MINPIEKELGIAVMRNELAVLENEKEAETKPDLKATIEISIKAKQLEIDTAIKASPELTEMNDVLKGMKANKDRLKKDLGGFYTVIINKTIRAAEPENRLSGFMVFDYDVFDLDYAAIKKSLKPISYIQGFFPSPSGGLKVIIATDLNGSNTDKKLFGYAYDAVFADLTERGIDLEFDQAGKDNQYQICYFAYDEHAYFNNDVIPFKYVNKAKALVADEQAEYAKNQLKYQNVKSDDIEFNEIVEMVNQLNTNGWHYNDYLNDVAFGFINDFGEEGKRFAIQFCNQRYGKQGNMGYDWQKMLGDKTPSTATLRKNKGTLIKACKSQGIERKSKSDKVKEAKRKITEKQHELAEKKLNQHEYKTFDTATANEIAEIEEEIEATEQKVVELSKTTHDIVYELMQQLDFSSDDIIEKINKINSLQDNINSVDTSNYAVIEKLDEMMDDEKRDVLYMQWNLVQLEKMANHDPKSTAFNKIRVATGNLVSKERKKLETDTKARNFIGGLDGFCYVSDLDRYVFYVDNRWVKMTKEAFKHHYTILKDKMLYETFDNMRPSKIYVTYTFNDALPNTMNLMREQDWVKPDLTATDFNENFDGLFNSLAGGKAENKTHIERVVVWKYLYPEDYTIPSLNFSGAGNIGKNIFVEKMLGNLFNKEQVKTVKTQNIFGDFNDVLAGAIVVLIDEMPLRRDNVDKIKTLFGNTSIIINEKNISCYTVDNTPLYITSTNKVEGSILLEGDGDGVDRRFSILDVEKKAENHLKNRCDDIQDLIDVVSDKQQIARWLAVKIEEFKDLPQPKALHGADYKKLLNHQGDEYSEIIDDILLHPDFKCVTAADLYDIFKKKVGQFTKIKRGTFIGNLADKINQSAFLGDVKYKQRKKIGNNQLNVFYNTMTFKGCVQPINDLLMEY